MDKGPPPTLFVNDGSFMERFRQLQQEQEKGKNAKPEDSKPIKVVSGPLTPKPSISKANDAKKSSQGGSSGKLAFSLKQKSKLVPPPVKLADDDEDEIDTGYVSNDAPTKRQKLGQDDGIEQSSRQVDVAPPPPSDPTVKKVADKLASFVAKNGRPFEDVTRQKNPGDTPFKFLFDVKCSDYKYYEHRLAQEEKALSQSNEPQAYQTGTSIPSSRPTNGPQRLSQQQSSYQIPASALYDSVDVSRGSGSAGQAFSVGSSDEPGGSSNANSLALMEFYMKKADRKSVV